MNSENIFTIDTSSIKFGKGCTEEVGYEAKRFNIQNAMIVTDKVISELPLFEKALKALEKEKVKFSVFSKVSVEPTDTSFKEASQFAIDGNYDGIIAIGGGSSMDTAKGANLYSTYPADFLDYVNAPIGKGIRVPGPLKPSICIPTTAGTGSETTGGAIFDLEEMHAKTGLSDRFLRPSVGIIDPENIKTMPRMVAACSGFDVLCHGIESYTAMPFSDRESPDDPGERPAYQGSNPVSDVWSMRTIEVVSQNIVKSINDPNNIDARESMMLAASAAGVGFGNAGVHLPHGMSYAVSGNVKEFTPEGYPQGKPIVPHGLSVILNAPAVFRFTSPSNPQKHLKAASLLGVDTSNINEEDAGNAIADKLIELLRELGMPNGLSGLGYTENDVETLVKGTLPQHRVTKLSPIPVDKKDFEMLFSESLKLW